MVDIKREDITLSDRTKGISADEFAWGSYFYSEWIQSWYSTKWFKLWHRLDIHSLNERTEWYPVAVYPTDWSILSDAPNLAFFTKDGKLEMKWAMNGSEEWEWGLNWGWAVWTKPSWYPFVWGYVYGERALGFTEERLDLIKYADTYSLSWQTITNPRFENSAAWWTVGTWWTLTDDWMEHETWNTGTLSVAAPWHADASYWRLAFKVTNCTKWTVTLDVDGTDIVSSEDWRNWWFVGTKISVHDETTYTITLTPTSDFDGIIEAVNFNTYKNSSWAEKQVLTPATKHFAVERGGDIYIASWNVVDVLSTVDRNISKSVQIAKDKEEIVAITQQADSLLIWATDGLNSHQYYWNWVDTIPSEIINRDGQTIQAVTGTETVSYVLAGSGGVSGGQAYRLYAVSWYQRSLIASNAYKVENDQWNLSHYHPSKKFAFNDVKDSYSMVMYLDNLYIPWCDGIYQYWQTLPWLSKSWSRPVKYENGSNRLALYQDGAELGFTYRNDQRNYYVIVENANYNDYWYLVTNSLYWDKLGTRKALEKIKLWYKNLSKENWYINIYAIVDDDYFRRFDVTWVTNRPAIWDTYEVAFDTIAEVIDINKTNSSSWVISFRTISNGGSLSQADSNLTKVTWNGDATLSTGGNYDNLVFLKSIQSDNQEFGSDFVFWKNFVDNYIPFWHKIQFVIELVKFNTSNNRKRTPEVYELSFVSDITDVTL